jgi:hypothetical protein
LPLGLTTAAVGQRGVLFDGCSRATLLQLFVWAFSC